MKFTKVIKNYKIEVVHIKKMINVVREAIRDRLKMTYKV